MIRMFMTAGLAFGLWSATLPANAEVAMPETVAQKSCPDGQVWDKNKNKCVKAPRGSN